MNTPDSRLAHLLGTDVPVVRAPTAIRTTAHTAADAITRGGQFRFIDAGTSLLPVASVAASGLPADQLHTILAAIRKNLPALSRDDPLPIGVALSASTETVQQSLAIDAALAHRVRALWFASGAGDVPRWIEYARTSSTGAAANGSVWRPVIFVQVASVEDAVRAAAKWKADVIVAQAASPPDNHSDLSASPSTALLSSILAALSTLNSGAGSDPDSTPPILVAGGIASEAELAYLSLGASGVVLDARDFEHGDEDGPLGGTLPQLTLMEEVLLLGMKDKEGYLSFWNDHISYALRGCILIELALRRRIALVRDPTQQRLPLGERLVGVLDDRPTGEPTGILDDALRMMKELEQDRMSLKSWIDLLSGETYNLSKVHFQLRQVRDRLAQGLVNKGILRTELRNYYVFNLLTHPLADAPMKESVVARVLSLVRVSGTPTPGPPGKESTGTQCPVLRTVCLVCAAHAARVLDDVLARLTYEERAVAVQRRDHILAEILREGGAQSPSGAGGLSWWGAISQTEQGRAASGKVALEVAQDVQKEMKGAGREDDMCFALVVGVLDVLSKTFARSTWGW